MAIIFSEQKLVLDAYAVLVGETPGNAAYVAHQAYIQANGVAAYKTALNGIFATTSTADLATSMLSSLGLSAVFTQAQAEAYLTANASNRVAAMLDLASALYSYTGTDAGILAAKDVYVDTVEASYTYSSNATNIAGTDLSAIVSAGGDTFTLTSGSDSATANVFNSDMVFTPDGSDRILSLQDEDELTGTAGRTDNTLNVELGNQNTDEGTTGTVTPELNNIQIVNIDWTGNTATFDARYSDAITTLNLNRITADATAVLVDNLTTPAANLLIANASSANTDVTFQYLRSVLTGDDTMNLTLDSVYADDVVQNATGAAAGIEGFEAVNLHAVNGVEIDSLTVNEMESLVITGSGFLDIVDLTATAPVTSPEYDLLAAGSIANPSAVGLLEVDASAFAGELTLDITNALGGFADPANSGATVHTVVTGSAFDDVFWTGANIADTVVGSTLIGSDAINAGAGDDVIKTTASIENGADITNVEALELRQQVAAQTVDFDAFDANLTSLLMRGERAAAITFNLDDLGATLAEDGMVLRHGISGAGLTTVNAYLADASAADDLISLTVENDLNTGTTFDYTLDFDGDDADGDSFDTDGRVENVTVIDNDTESNILTLTAGQEHTGTVTLSGGVADQTYTVATSLVAATLDASAQLSDLRLIVGDTVGTITNVNQDILLGSGDDLLTFRNIDDFNSSDTITDAGGDDTVRAAFSDDADLTLTGIEGLHIIANANVELDMTNADVENLVILADIAADGSADASPVTAEPFTIAGVATSDIITLTDTNLTVLNFFADLDTDDDNTAANRVIAEAAAVAASATWTGIGSTAAGDAAYKLTISDENTAAVFNGVTLANNSANALTVNINSSLDTVIYGATSYTLGQLTAHGITSMDIQISDEDITAGAANAVTTINNIYAKNMTALSVTAADDVDLNTVSGAPLNNSLLTFDASNVGGDLTADVISLGNNAVVTLADGDNTFSALGSAGKDIVITAGNGNNTITGSGQDDEITTGSGWDTVAGDRGDNVISTGAGNDTVTAKDGNDTYDVGTGTDNVTDNLSTGIDATLATNTVSMSGGITELYIDVAGDGAGAGDVNQMLAVGVGSDLTLSWTGATLITASAVLDGRLADVDVFTTDASSDLGIATAAGVDAFSGGAGNDVYITAIAAGTGTAVAFTGGTGNDAAIGSDGTDLFTGGAGADKYALQQSTPVLDGDTDAVIIADSESTASAWDQVFGFQASADVAATLAAAAVAATNVGGDYLDLALAATFTAGAVDGTDVGTTVQSHSVSAAGLVTFDDVDAYAGAVQVGTGTGQISLANALAYLALNVISGETYAFTYDANGDGAMNASDSTFVFQDGSSDTVVELVGVVATGVSVVGAADYAATTIEIA